MEFCIAITIAITIILHNSCITYGYAVNKHHGDCIPGLEDLCALCEPYKTQTGKAVAYPGKDGDVLKGCHHFVECFWTTESISAPYLRSCGVLGDGIYRPTSEDDKHCVEADTLTVSEHPCGTKGSGDGNKTRWKRDEDDYLSIQEVGGRKCSGDKDAYRICHLCPDYVRGNNDLIPYPGLNNDPLDGCHKYIDCRYYDQPFDYLLPLVLICIEHGKFNIGMRNGIWMDNLKKCVNADTLTSKEHICGTKDEQEETTPIPGHGVGHWLLSDPEPLTSDPAPLTSDPEPLTSDPEPLLSDPESETATPENDAEKPSLMMMFLTTDPESETTKNPDSETGSSESETTTPDSEVGSSESETTTPPPDSEVGSSESETTTPPPDADAELETTTPPPDSEVGSSESETTTPSPDSEAELEATTPPPDSETISSEPEQETTTASPDSETVSSDQELETTTLPPDSDAETTTTPPENK